jgi:DNA-binding NarL/FixJ family response regulator
VACLAELPEQGTAEGVALMCALAQDGIYRCEYAAARDWAERARAAALSLGDPLSAAAAVGWTAAGCAFGGEVDTSRAACTELAAIVDALPDEELGRSPELAVNLASAELLVDRYAEAGLHIERALGVARAHGRDHHFPALFWTGLVRVALGRVPDAVALLDEAVEIARSTGRSSMLGWMLLARSTAAAAAGDTATALDTAQESVDALPGPGLSAGWAALAHADALLAVGDAERARQVLADVVDVLPAPLRCRAFEVLTGCAIACDRRSDAERPAAACARVREPGSARAVAARAGALVALHRGDAPQAVELALAAAAGFVDTPLDEAQARLVASRALAVAGRLEHAADEAVRAAAIFDRCGAPARRAAAERELRRLGHRRLHRRSRPGTGDVGVAALTERELQVARMIVDRRTNAEIAAALFLSPKTVESHVRNLFHKLSVSSRVEVARAVERAVQ